MLSIDVRPHFNFSEKEVEMINNFLEINTHSIAKQKDLPYYIGIVKDKNDQLKVIDPQKYILKHWNAERESLKKGNIYQVKKDPEDQDLVLEKTCRVNQINEEYHHFAKIILASSAHNTDLNEKCRGEYCFYAGSVAEWNNPLEALKWFQLAADLGHALGSHTCYELAKDPNNGLPLSPIQYLYSAKEQAEEGSNEMLMIDETLMMEEELAYLEQHEAPGPPAFQ